MAVDWANLGQETVAPKRSSGVDWANLPQMAPASLDSSPVAPEIAQTYQNKPAVGLIKGVPHPDPQAELAALQARTSNVQPANIPATGPQNAAAGALHAATSIGSTLLTPFDKTLHAIDPSFRSPAERRADLNSFYQQNFDPNSWSFKGGDLAGSIAGTAGVGSALAIPARAAGAAVPALANIAPKVATALESGGFRLGGPAADASAPFLSKLATALGNTAIRAGSGALVGGTSAGLIDLNNAPGGALIGGALPLAAQAVGAVARGGSKLLGGTIGNMVGQSGKAISTAYEAGKAGDTSFTQNLRDPAKHAEEVVDQMRQGLNNMYADRAAAYRSGMVDVSADKSVLDFSPIQKAVDDLKGRGTFNGKVIAKHASDTVQELADKVAEWQAGDPAIDHTPEGLDALKKAIGDIRDSTQFHTPSRAAADSIYNAVKSQIVKQAPTYSRVMADYSEATDQLTELQRSLSLGEKASKDTALRKLQSIMRNNVNTNFGNRLASVNAIEQQGGVNVLPALAGQSLSAWAPRGVAGAIEKGGLPMAIGGLVASGHPAAAVGMLGTAPFTSPRLMGEAAYGLGRLSGAVSPFASKTGTMLAKQAPLLPGVLNSNPYASLLGRTLTGANSQ